MSILVRFKKIYISEMRIKNWIEWTTKMSKVREKIWTRTYCKCLLLPFTFESQSGPEKPDYKRNIFTLWQEFLSQYWGKYRWIPLRIFILVPQLWSIATQGRLLPMVFAVIFSMKDVSRILLCILEGRTAVNGWPHLTSLKRVSINFIS